MKIQKSGNRITIKVKDGKEIEDLPIMMEKNQIESVLPFVQMCIDGEYVFSYDVSGLESLEERYQKKEVREEEICDTFTQISMILEQAKEWFMEETEFCFTPETIFYKENRVKLLWVPGANNDRNVQVEQVAEYFMKKVNPENRQTACFIYQLYRSCKLKEFCWQSIDLSKTETSTILSFEEKTEYKDIEHEDVARTSKKNNMGEKKEGDKKFVCLLVLILLIFIGVLAIKTGILQSSVTGRWDVIKVAAFVVILIVSISYVATKFVKKKEKVSYPQRISNETVLLGREEKREEVILESIDGSQEAIRIHKFPFYIGADKNHVDGIIENPGVSRVHGWFDWQGTNLYYTDRNSTNGTKLNGKRLIPGEGVRIETGVRMDFANTGFYVKKSIL